MPKNPWDDEGDHLSATKATNGTTRTAAILPNAAATTMSSRGMIVVVVRRKVAPSLSVTLLADQKCPLGPYGTWIALMSTLMSVIRRLVVGLPPGLLCSPLPERP